MNSNSRKTNLGEIQDSFEKKIVRCFIATGFPVGILFLWIFCLLVEHDFTFTTITLLITATILMCFGLYLWFFVPLSSYKKGMNLAEVFSHPKVIVNDVGLHFIRKEKKETIKFDEISEIFLNPNLNYFVVILHPAQKNRENFILIGKSEELDNQQIKEKLTKKCNVNFDMDMSYDILKKQINAIGGGKSENCRR